MYIFTLQAAAALRNLRHQILPPSHRKNLYMWWNLWYFLQHNLICACFPICDFSPALVHLFFFVILIYRFRRSRFISISILLELHCIRYSWMLSLFDYSREDHVSVRWPCTGWQFRCWKTLGVFSVQYLWLLSSKKIRDRSLLATLYYVQ